MISGKKTKMPGIVTSIYIPSIQEAEARVPFDLRNLQNETVSQMGGWGLKKKKKNSLMSVQTMF
jgi:hypothetical protein